jgi:hypothetical protein
MRISVVTSAARAVSAPRDVISLQNLDLCIARALKPSVLAGRATSPNDGSGFA